MPSHTAPSGHFNQDAIRGVRNVLLSAYGSTGEERLYITRSKAAKRRIVNEDEIAPILADFGFQTVFAEDLSFEEQVHLCSRARLHRFESRCRPDEHPVYARRRERVGVETSIRLHQQLLLHVSISC